MSVRDRFAIPSGMFAERAHPVLRHYQSMWRHTVYTRE